MYSIVKNIKFSRSEARFQYGHECGYLVEMDDFGSGYSSLNVLKDIDFDIIKLDMMFLSQESDSNRGGTIVSAVIRMAKWLDMPVIAEGVETIKQADFLRSIGCDSIPDRFRKKNMKNCCVIVPLVIWYRKCV